MLESIVFSLFVMTVLSPVIQSQYFIAALIYADSYTKLCEILWQCNV